MEREKKKDSYHQLQGWTDDSESSQEQCGDSKQLHLQILAFIHKKEKRVNSCWEGEINLMTEDEENTKTSLEDISLDK